MKNKTVYDHNSVPISPTVSIIVAMKTRPINYVTEKYERTTLPDSRKNILRSIFLRL